MVTTPNPAPGDPRLSAETAELVVPPARREDPVWDGWDVAGLFVVAVLALVLASLAALVVARHLGAFHGEKISALLRNPRVALPGQALGYAVIVAFMYSIVRRSGARFWRALKWNWPRMWVAYLVLGVGVALGLQLLAAKLPIPKKLPIDELFRDAASAYLMAFFGVLVAPLIEELFFRGFLYPVLLRACERLAAGGVAMGMAVALTALPFALMHAGQLAVSWAPLLVLFLVGVALTLVRARTQSLAASVLTHAGYNLTLFVMIWLASDHFRHLERLAR